MNPIATFHHSEFADISSLVREKERLGVRISLCIPSLNEEDTIGEVVQLLKNALLDARPLLDEILVIDSGSSDRTCEVAEAAGATVYLASNILPKLPMAKGKGENIWKATYQAKGDILCFVDGDVRNMHPRFVYGPLGALLLQSKLKYVKAFYDRPHSLREHERPIGGGRVTEALVRPLFSLFFPELSGLIQPLSGEYAAWRETLEKIPMPSGYGVETAHLLDIFHGWGASAIGQCDLDERVHRHQDTASLGRMSFAILQAFFLRAEQVGKLQFDFPLSNIYRRYAVDDGHYRTIEEEIRETERPPLCDILEYRQKFQIPTVPTGVS